jgi:tRNA A-37 threonylcarbamoyl transferase component Bud32
MIVSTLYSINWQRHISIELVKGRKVVLKRDKLSKDFHEFLLVSSYTFISLLLAHPAAPPPFGRMAHKNEGFNMRECLHEIGIRTPMLLSITDSTISEEYIVGGNLYRALVSDGANAQLSYEAGSLTGRLHKAGYAFIDNKCQNYLIGGRMSLIRTDIGFIQKTTSVFPRSMDVGTFLASIIDLPQTTFRMAENAFFNGYKEQTGNSFPYLSIILRNILSFGFTSDRLQMVRNVISNTAKKSRFNKIK